MAQSSSRGGRCVGDYLVGRQIGSGSFSVVWHARHKVHGAEVAIKEIVLERLNKKLQDSLLSEIDILKQINHPNIIRLHDIIQETGRIHLVLEYCRGGDLSMYIQQRQGRVPEGTAKYFMQQLAAGLQVLHENKYMHRDLKPQNLLLSTNSDNAVLKIADFGFARSLEPRDLAATLCGSPLYMAPEIIQLQKYDEKADLWSAGAILFQLVTGKTPFTGSNQTELFQNIVKSTELQFPGDKKDLSSDCIDLCQKLLCHDPGYLRVFDYKNEQLICGGKSYYGALLCCAWSKNGKYILTGGEDDLVQVWSMEDRKVVAWGEGHNSWVSGVAFDSFWSSPNSDDSSQNIVFRFGSVGQDAQLLLWDLEMDEIVVPLRRAPGGSPTFSSGSQSSHWDSAYPLGTLQPAPSLRDVPKLSPMVAHRVHTEPLSGLLFTQESVVTVCREGHIKIWTRPGFPESQSNNSDPMLSSSLKEKQLLSGKVGSSTYK